MNTTDLKSSNNIERNVPVTLLPCVADHTILHILQYYATGSPEKCILDGHITERKGTKKTFFQGLPLKDQRFLVP